MVAASGRDGLGDGVREAKQSVFFVDARDAVARRNHARDAESEA